MSSTRYRACAMCKCPRGALSSQVGHGLFALAVAQMGDGAPVAAVFKRGVAVHTGDNVNFTK